MQTKEILIIAGVALLSIVLLFVIFSNTRKQEPTLPPQQAPVVAEAPKEITEDEKKTRFSQRTDIYFSPTAYTSREMKGDFVELRLNDKKLGSQYFLTGKKIEKIITETPLRTMIDMPWVNKVSIMVLVEGKTYSTTQTREQIESYTGEKLSEYKTAGEYIQKIWKSTNDRTKFYDKFIKK